MGLRLLSIGLAVIAVIGATYSLWLARRARKLDAIRKIIRESRPEIITGMQCFDPRPPRDPEGGVDA